MFTSSETPDLHIKTSGRFLHAVDSLFRNKKHIFYSQVANTVCGCLKDTGQQNWYTLGNSCLGSKYNNERMNAKLYDLEKV